MVVVVVAVVFSAIVVPADSTVDFDGRVEVGAGFSLAGFGAFGFFVVEVVPAAVLAVVLVVVVGFTASDSNRAVFSALLADGCLPQADSTDAKQSMVIIAAIQRFIFFHSSL